jgi:hypothetical protein
MVVRWVGSRIEELKPVFDEGCPLKLPVMDGVKFVPTVCVGIAGLDMELLVINRDENTKLSLLVDETLVLLLLLLLVDVAKTISTP